MYRLREFERDDLGRMVRELPGCADVAREVADHDGDVHGVVVEAGPERLCAWLVAARHDLVTSARTIGLGVVRLAHVFEPGRIGGIHSTIYEVLMAFAERFEGPDRAFQAVVGRWHEQDVWWLRRLHDYEPVAQSLVFEGKVAGAPAPEGVQIEPLRADAALSWVERGGVGVRRSPASIVRHGRSNGRTTWIARRGEQVHAVALARGAEDHVVLDHLDVDWSDRSLTRALLGATAAGRPLRTTRWTDHEAELAALQAAGLRIRGPERLLAARVSAFGLAPISLTESASFGELDVGGSTLPRLSHNEREVTPPPPGTRNTDGDHRRTRKRSQQVR